MRRGNSQAFMPDAIAWKQSLRWLKLRVPLSGRPTCSVKPPRTLTTVGRLANAEETWEWACAAGYLRRITDRAHAANLSARRAALDDEQRRLLGEIIRVCVPFMGLRRGITTTIATALTKFAMTVRKLGAGTGKAAERHRRAIREAAMEAAGAVPCWILPEWRVAEQLPSELAIFHLVIIDEASQSDITALPAVMRGQKLLIVGDDRQVSPISVGMEERTVIQLRETFLRGMPIANYLDPATSMYDLASMMFPGTTIMLREHFRCVEPIIRFSSRLCYKDKGGLVPLRVPTADQRARSAAHRYLRQARPKATRH